jgi:hypothetical protein
MLICAYHTPREYKLLSVVKQKTGVTQISLPIMKWIMSEAPPIREILPLVRWRVEPFAILLLAFAFLYYVNVLVYGDSSRLSAGALLYAAGWNFLLALFLAFLFELSYAAIRIAGSLFLRTGRLWTYSVPALSVFFVIVEPIFTSGRILDVILKDHGIVSSIYLTMLMILSVLIFLLLVYLPVFHGLNAAFLLASILLSRLLLLPLQNLFFPHPADFSIGLFLLFSVLAISLAFLFYLYLQTRRRTGLSPHYERFDAGFSWFVVPLILIVCSGFGLVYLREKQRLFHPLLDIFYLNLIASLSIALIFLYSLLRYEARNGKPFRLPALWFSVFLLMVCVSTLMGLVRSYQPDYAFFARKTAAGQFLELISVLADRDRDGNSFWPGQDADDSNPGIRREGRGEYRYNRLDLRPEGYPSVDRILITFVIEGSVLDNPLYATEPNVKLSAPEGWPYWMQPSNQPERSLRALFQGLTSYEEVNGVERRSLLSMAAEDGYRTLCFGFDDGSNYFRHDHPARLDAGCQVFEALPIPQSDQLETCMSDSLQAAEKLIAQYREKHTFVWLHLDARRCGKSRLTFAERFQAIMQILTGLHSPQSSYPFLSDPSRRMLGVIMETGYLPRFYVRARDEFWRAERGAMLYGEILSGHLFFLRWYFADMLEGTSGNEKGPAVVLRNAEAIYQKNGAADMNGWVFLQEDPDESIRWFRQTIGLQSDEEHRLPAMMLYYDARRRRLIYSHGMWNRTVEFEEKPSSPVKD